MRKGAALVLMVIAAVTLGCSWRNDQPASNSASTSNTETATNTVAATTRENPAADIDTMADKFLAQKAFRAKMSATGDKDFTTEIAFVAPDRFWIKTGPGLERIIIGKDVYITLDGSWEKLPGGLSGSPDDMRKAFEKERHKWFSDLRYAGEETANGMPAYVYDYTNRGEGNAGENDSRIWIAKDDGLPVRIESRYKTGSIKTMTVEYEYDPNIKIEAPKTK